MDTDCYSVYCQGNPIDYASCDKKIDWDGIANTVQQSHNIIFVGGDSMKQGAEGHARSQIELPPNQPKFFETVYNSIIDCNTQNIMTVLIYGVPVIVQFVFNNSIAILGATYAGEQIDPAITELLNGSTVPNGNTTWLFCISRNNSATLNDPINIKLKHSSMGDITRKEIEIIRHRINNKCYKQKGGGGTRAK